MGSRAIHRRRQAVSGEQTAPTSAYDEHRKEETAVNHEVIHRLIQDEAGGRYSRRQILQRAAALGLSAPAVAALFAGAIPVRVQPLVARSGGGNSARWLRPG